MVAVTYKKSAAAAAGSLVRFDVVVLPGAVAAQTDLALATVRGRVSAIAYDAAVAAQFRAEVKAELNGAGVGIPSIADFDVADLAAETPSASLAMVNPSPTPSPVAGRARRAPRSPTRTA